MDIESGAKLGPCQEGEIWIKSPLAMKGYMGDKAASDALVDKEGYIQTGDIGYYDEDGCFYIVDRLKELIKYKGFQVISFNCIFEEHFYSGKLITYSWYKT